MVSKDFQDSPLNEEHFTCHTTAAGVCSHEKPESAHERRAQPESDFAQHAATGAYEAKTAFSCGCLFPETGGREILQRFSRPPRRDSRNWKTANVHTKGDTRGKVVVVMVRIGTTLPVEATTLRAAFMADSLQIEPLRVSAAGSSRPGDRLARWMSAIEYYEIGK